MLQNISSEKLWRGAPENLSKMGRLYTLMWRGDDKSQNTDISPSDGDVAINMSVCAQKWSSYATAALLCVATFSI